MKLNPNWNQMLSALTEVLERVEIQLDYAKRGHTKTVWTDKQNIAKPGAVANSLSLELAVIRARALVNIFPAVYKVERFASNGGEMECTDSYQVHTYAEAIAAVANEVKSESQGATWRATEIDSGRIVAEVEL
jgi:hypothetical protein